MKEKKTEFWAVIGGMVSTILTDILGIDIDPIQFVAVWTGIVAYVYSRTRVKEKKLSEGVE